MSQELAATRPLARLSADIYRLPPTIELAGRGHARLNPRVERWPLRVIPEPEEGTRNLFVRSGAGETGPFFAAEQTNIAATCGMCDETLLSGVHPEQFANVVFKCFRCGACNEIPG